MRTKNWTRIDISCGPETAEYLASELAESFGVTVEFTAGGIRVYFDSARFEDERERLGEVLRSASAFEGGDIIYDSSEIPDEDWSETWKAHFKPLRVGRHILISPTWEKVRPEADDLLIQIDPGRAFGTGHHETTRLCLEWLESWASNLSGKHPGALLDVGTGSGILAMAGALLGFDKIIGIDNDPEAIEVALQNLELNSLNGKVNVSCATPDEITGTFDVVISNIQSLPLIRMSRTMVSKVSVPGRLVLSGILTEQADDVRAEYENRGLKLTGTQTAGEWILLAFEKR